MDNLLSYCGLIDARISTCEKDLPVHFSLFNLFSTFMTSPGLAFQECTGSCHVDVPVPKAVSSQSVIDRWSDCIGSDRYSRPLGTLKVS